MHRLTKTQYKQVVHLMELTMTHILHSHFSDYNVFTVNYNGSDEISYNLTGPNGSHLSNIINRAQILKNFGINDPRQFDIDEKKD